MATITGATAFRKATSSGATSDLFDVGEALRQADISRAQIASIAGNPKLDNPAGLLGHHQSVEQRKSAQTRLAGNIMQMVSRTQSRASGERNLTKARCTDPDLAPGGQSRRDQEVRRYSDTLIEMDDGKLVDEAGKLIAGMSSTTYDLAGAVAEELHRRRLDALATDVKDAVHAARSAYLTDPRYLAARDLITRTDAWLSNADQADPELTITVDGREYTARVSELLEPEPVAPAPKPTTRKAARSEAPKTPGPGMIDHFVAGPPLKR
jgi:hypothetical protein